MIKLRLSDVNDLGSLLNLSSDPKETRRDGAGLAARPAYRPVAGLSSA
jgi:hypothetical protein